MWPLIIGAGIGLLKGVEGQSQAADERKRQAAIARYSPWTGMSSHTVQDPSLLGNIAQGGAAGAMMGQAMNAMPAAASSAPSLSAAPLASSAPNLGNFSQQLGSAAAPSASAAKMASGIGLGGLGQQMGSAGALGGAGKSPWSLMDPNQPFDIFNKTLANNPY